MTYPFSDCCPNLPGADPGCDDDWCCTHETWHDDVTGEFESPNSPGRDNEEASPTGTNQGTGRWVLPSG